MNGSHCIDTATTFGDTISEIRTSRFSSPSFIPNNSSAGMGPSASARRAAGGAHMCYVCGKTFTKSSLLRLHYRRVHAGERPFECEVCGKSFGVKKSLGVHLKIHARDKPYKCSHCDEEFEQSVKLERHVLIHTGERPHRCTDCGKSFFQGADLVLHRRSHTGEKPYVCSVCNKGFACKNRHKVHSRIHTDERSVACDLCGKTFANKYLLKQHRQVVHLGERPYKCTVCTDDFTYMRALNAHIKTHKLSHQPTSFQQDSVAAVVSSSTPNSPITSNPCDIGVGIVNRIIVECLNSTSPPQQSQGVSKSFSVGQLSYRSDLFLPHDPQNNARYTDNEKNHQPQPLASMIFGAVAVNRTDTNRGKQMGPSNNLQKARSKNSNKVA